jgi:MFS superfamily sulfate permease-like transporter
LHEAEDVDKYAEILKYEKMLKSYKSMGIFGEVLALCLVELLLVLIFIKPVFSKKLKFILLDISLIAVSALVALFCWEWWSFRQENALLCVFIALVIHYVLLRLLRPVKRYGNKSFASDLVAHDDFLWSQVHSITL